MSVAVEPSAAFTFGNPVKVLSTAYVMTVGGRTYDVAPDGRKFLMIKGTTDVTRTGTPGASIVVVLNWVEEVKARLPVTRP